MSSKFRWQKTCSTDDFAIRKKVSIACLSCRKKRQRCNGENPCDRCVRAHLTCTYAQLLTKTKPPSNIDGSRLRATLTMENDLYTSLAHAHIQSTSRLPPLLFGFFTPSSQPVTLWTRLHSLLLQWHRTQTSLPLHLPRHIATVALPLFLNHNTLYSLFLPADLLQQTLADSSHPYLPSHPPDENHAIELLLDACLALTFLAAAQTLADTLMMDIACLFYQSVKKRWLHLIFSPSRCSPPLLAHLIQVSILLVHYQCAKESEEQAYLTCLVAHGCFEQYQSFNVHPLPISLVVTLHAWQVWLAVYLHRPDPPPLVLPDHPTVQTAHPTSWTWSVLLSFLPFLNNLLAPPPTLSLANLIDQCQQLVHYSPASEATPAQQIVNLYRYILTIQVLAGQWTDDLHFFTKTPPPAEPAGQSQQACLAASEQIIQLLDTMHLIGQDVTSHQSSSPSLLPMRYRALCLAACVLARVPASPLLAPLFSILRQDAKTWSFARDCLASLQSRLATDPSSPSPAAPSTPLSTGSQHQPSQSFHELTYPLDMMETGSSPPTASNPRLAITTADPATRRRTKMRPHIDQEQLNKFTFKSLAVPNQTPWFQVKPSVLPNDDPVDPSVLLPVTPFPSAPRPRSATVGASVTPALKTRSATVGDLHLGGSSRSAAKRRRTVQMPASPMYFIHDIDPTLITADFAQPLLHQDLQSVMIPMMMPTTTSSSSSLATPTAATMLASTSPASSMPLIYVHPPPHPQDKPIATTVLMPTTAAPATAADATLFSEEPFLDDFASLTGFYP
ncbi:hypothetical protein DM01DRAFT_1406284 [Hesseltinella vesiculosa]|uniref:Zn(2)-C6 fungal-type domain-containing protein n=1 Tax=Hesseltinella vesiculosa TaxID=101127 RepID=A0A1X2GLV8_9FUNG|nr:hypothetical protein DM01DRAFT_1406284 [Hesseltinella vesiculosa]